MRTDDKIKEIEKYLSELEEIIPKDFHKYKNDLKTKAACERYFEKIIEAATDLAFLLIKDKKYKIPEDDKEAFEILSDNGDISRELAVKLKEAKGMRNIIAHQYGKTDDKLVFNSITKEIKKDVKKMLKFIEQ
ncbi:MAG: DUF86 domain-containing protein [Candidatus Nanoarchaeia archaeon]|nr:DUF86 domain-containing protein [Candidatus Nanoarchaeia archaeon]